MTAARRVQLAVTTSVVRQLSTEISFGGEQSQRRNSEKEPATTTSTTTTLADISTTNIDEALRSLYDVKAMKELSLKSSSASYLPEHSVDWLLDSGYSNSTREDEDCGCAQLLLELHMDPLEKVELQIKNWEERAAKEEREQQELENWNAFSDEDSAELEFFNNIEDTTKDDDGDDFGDFQSALVNDDEGDGSEEKKFDNSDSGPLREFERCENVHCEENDGYTYKLPDVVVDAVSNVKLTLIRSDIKNDEEDDGHDASSQSDSEQNNGDHGNSSTVNRTLDARAQLVINVVVPALPAAAETPKNIDATSTIDDDTPDLLRQVDQLLGRFQPGGNDEYEKGVVSPPESTSSVDTPDLVRWTDEILLISKVATFEGSETLPQHEHQLEYDASCIIDQQTVRTTEAKVGNEESERNVDTLLRVRTMRLPAPTNVHMSSTPPSQAVSPQCLSRMSSSVVPDDDSVQLSLLLPVNDLSTLEARFTRRLQQHYEQSLEQCIPLDSREPPAQNGDSQARLSHNDSFSRVPKELDLPTYYYTNPNLDDTVSLLESLPWHYVLPPTGRGPRSTRDAMADDKNNFDATEYLGLWDENTTSRLCHLDSALEQIQSDLLKQIQPHQPTVQRANASIHDWEQNLRLAFMYWERSTQSIESAIGSEHDASGLVAPIALSNTWQQREEYQSLNGTLVELNGIWAREQDLLNRIDHFDVTQRSALDKYFDVMKLARELDGIVIAGRFERLHSLDDMRLRLTTIGKRFWDRFFDLAKSVVVRCCRCQPDFEWVEYERLVRAVLDLHSKGVDRSVNVDLASTWTENIIATLSYEADWALAAALADPMIVEESTFNQELRQLKYDVDLHWGDSAKLRSISHEMVTIRFDFESQINHLPLVFHQLCKLLTGILHTHYQLVEWHRVPFDDRLKVASAGHAGLLDEQDPEHVDLSAILTLMQESTKRIWEQCESVVAKCLDEHLHFATKRSLFKRSKNGIDDTLWRDDLESLHDVLLLTGKFLSFKKSFLGEDGEAQGLALLLEDRNSLLSEKLSDLFRRHLRSVHVEAMNTIGRRLSSETWGLGNFSVPAKPERTEVPDASLESLLQGALAEASKFGTHSGAKDKVMQEKSFRCQFSELTLNDDPFLATNPGNVDHSVAQVTMDQDENAVLPPSKVHLTLSSVIGTGDGGLLLAPETVTHELVAWFARLIFIMKKLPLITDDISAVFANLCDLYFTTVFRICAGNAKSERILLGEDSPSPLLIVREDLPPTLISDENTGGSQLFSSFRKTTNRSASLKSPSQSRTVLPSYLEAEICSPMRPDGVNEERLRKFIQRAQKSLRDVVNLDMVDSWMLDPHSDTTEEEACKVAVVLAKREGAIWSSLTVAALVETAYKLARRNLASSFMKSTVVGDELVPLKAYSQNVLDVTPTLALVARQIACSRAVAGSEIVKEIIKVGVVWQESKLHEYSNNYIDDLCDRCALIWGYLTASAKLPPLNIKAIWENIVSASYRSLLDGFARVSFCSTEGRALMTLDLASFAAGISSAGVAEHLKSVLLVNKPPAVDPECNFRYVETYIKVFYYPKDDVLHWIAENYDNYKLNHSLALVVAAAASSSEITLNELLEHVKMLYRRHGGEKVHS